MGLRWLAVLLITACASGPEPTVAHPQQTADDFVAAIVRDDPEGAYKLLDGSLRQGLAPAGFRQMWQDSRQEMLAMTQSMERSDAASVAHATVTLEDNNQVSLALEDGHWKLAGGVVDAYSLSTPTDAVLALRRALQRQSLAGVLRVLSRKRRAAWLAAFEQSIEATADPLDMELEISGDRATIRTSNRTTIELVRENGQWHISEVK